MVSIMLSYYDLMSIKDTYGEVCVTKDDIEKISEFLKHEGAITTMSVKEILKRKQIRQQSCEKKVSPKEKCNDKIFTENKNFLGQVTMKAAEGEQENLSLKRPSLETYDSLASLRCITSRRNLNIRSSLCDELELLEQQLGLEPRKEEKTSSYHKNNSREISNQSPHDEKSSKRVSLLLTFDNEHESDGVVDDDLNGESSHKNKQKLHPSSRKSFVAVIKEDYEENETGEFLNKKRCIDIIQVKDCEES